MKTSCDLCGHAVTMLPLRDGTRQAFERRPVRLSEESAQIGWIVGWTRYRLRAVLAARPVREVHERELPPAARVFLLHECQNAAPVDGVLPSSDLAAA